MAVFPLIFGGDNGHGNFFNVGAIKTLKTLGDRHEDRHLDLKVRCLLPSPMD
jgi:hypothetical protein